MIYRDGVWIDCNRNSSPDCRRIAPRPLDGVLQGNRSLPIMDIPDDWIMDPDGDGPEIICGPCAAVDEISEAMGDWERVDDELERIAGGGEDDAEVKRMMGE